MRVSRMVTAASVALVLGGCTHPIHLGGEYAAREDPRGFSAEREKLAEVDRWVFLWGFVDDGKVELQPKLDQALGSTQVVTDMDVDESTTILGYVLGFFTAGIVTEQKVVVEGRRAVAPRHDAPITRE